MCAAGPPKAVRPRRPKRRTNSPMRLSSSRVMGTRRSNAQPGEETGLFPGLLALSESAPVWFPAR
jgi:hypothetical protein